MPLGIPVKLLAAIIGVATCGAGNAGMWRRAAMKDIRAADLVFQQNHPGWLDPRNGGFRAQLFRARANGLAKARLARSYAGYAEALGAFSAALNDGHARLAPIPQKRVSHINWPGFITAWRGNGLFVQRGNPPPGVAIGDRIVSCDGMRIRQMIASRLTSQGMRLKQPGHWWARSPQAFVDMPAMGSSHPRTCIFAGAKKAHPARLDWRRAPADIVEQLRAAANGERTAIGLTEARAGLFLIGLSDFNPDAAGDAAYEKLFKEIASDHSRLLRARAIILDLRWNDGGSSDWALKTAELLWGKDAVARRLNDYRRSVQIWWRASADNVKYLQGLAGSSDASDAADATLLAQKVAAARGTHRPFYIESAFDPALSLLSANTDLDTKVYVIVPGGCASACLDAVDTFKLFANVKLIGAPSAGDSLYVDARPQDLPSGKGRAIVPLKIWMNRPRRSGEVYLPDIEVDDLDWSIQEFLDAVEKDLVRSKSMSLAPRIP